MSSDQMRRTALAWASAKQPPIGGMRRSDLQMGLIESPFAPRKPRSFRGAKGDYSLAGGGLPELELVALRIDDPAELAEFRFFDLFVDRHALRAERGLHGERQGPSIIFRTAGEKGWCNSLLKSSLR